MDDAIATYFRARNEQDPEQRWRMLERCVTDDAVLVGKGWPEWRSASAATSRLHRIPKS